MKVGSLLEMKTILPFSHSPLPIPPIFLPPIPLLFPSGYYRNYHFCCCSKIICGFFSQLVQSCVVWSRPVLVVESRHIYNLVCKVTAFNNFPGFSFFPVPSCSRCSFDVLSTPARFVLSCDVLFTALLSSTLIPLVTFCSVLRCPVLSVHCPVILCALLSFLCRPIFLLATQLPESAIKVVSSCIKK
jgi:hypothetical protein